MTLAVDPSVSDVLDDESDKQAGDQDSTCSSFVFNPFNAVVRQKELRVGKKLYSVSGQPGVESDRKHTCTIAVEMTTPVPNCRIATMSVLSMLTDVNLEVNMGANTPMALVTKMTKRRAILKGTL
jgi:hypothetical protein